MTKIISLAVAGFLSVVPVAGADPLAADIPPLELKEQPGPRVKPIKTYVPGHRSETGEWVRPYEREGGALPPLAPGERSKGYVPGHHDENGAWVPGHAE